jgi:predicted translin family RNA/ssDNA-binding protein
MARMIVENRDYVLSKYKLHKLKEIEDLVSEAVEVNVPFNNYVTGFCAFTASLRRCFRVSSIIANTQSSTRLVFTQRCVLTIE